MLSTVQETASPGCEGICNRGMPTCENADLRGNAARIQLRSRTETARIVWQIEDRIPRAVSEKLYFLYQ